MDRWEYAMLIGLIVGLGVFCVFVFISSQETQKEIDDGMKKWQEEHDAVLVMNCTQLHDGLLHDTIHAYDNRQLTSTHYVSNCEGRKQ